ncbi:MAG: hypothetical protein GXO63_02930 [Candidatus Micrarchaeota archaeon]|nr:hypothetical protein [Candidatus Micrarchaeota archaeon]
MVRAIKKIITSWQVVLLLAVLTLSVFFISPNPFATGVVVKDVSPNSPFYGKIDVGDIIVGVNDKKIENPEDFYVFSDYTGTLRIFTKDGVKISTVSGNLGITVSEVPKSKIKLGMDIVGGTRVLLKVEGNASDRDIEETINTLRTRINIYGLREANFREASSGNEKYIIIEMAGGTREEIENLLSKQGGFEARIPFKTKPGGTIKFGGKNYSVPKDIEVNQTLTLGGIKFVVTNITNSSAVLEAVVFESEDVKSVCMYDQPGVCRAYIREASGGYEFGFQVFISVEAAERFAELTSDMPVVFDVSRRDYVLKGGTLLLYLDKKLITSLSIDKDLKGKAETQPFVTGFRTTKEDALFEKNMLQSILKSGKLPVKLRLESVDEISPSLGRKFLSSMVTAGLLAIIVVSLVVFLRYRNPKISVPMLLTSFSEVIIILGIASLINWTIDLPAIAGILIVLGTGIDAQIMIIDELLGTRRILSLKEKIKRAFFIIFTSAGVTGAAMIPLMFMGVGTPLAGFAITTIIGIAASVLITRPAFGKMVEVLVGEKI